MNRRGAVTLEAMLALSAYALVVAAFAGLEHGFANKLSQEAREAGMRAELSSACLSLDWFALGGQGTKLSLELNSSRYSAAGRRLEIPGGPWVECRSRLRSSEGELKVQAIPWVRG